MTGMNLQPSLPRISVAIASSTVLLGLLVPASAGADPTGDWPAWDGAATGEFRTWTIDDGEFIASSGIFQSRGANTDLLHHEEYWGAIMTGGELPLDQRDDVERHLTWGAFGVDRWANDGDQELPLDETTHPDFTAELAELRVTTDADEVFLRLRWTSMPAVDAQIATVTFSNAASTAVATPWPHAAGVRAPWDVAVTTWGTGATLTVNGVTPDEQDLTALGGDVRTGDHVVEVRVPRDLLPAGPWTVRGGGGLTDPDDRSQFRAVPLGSATDTAPGSGSTLFAGSPVWSLLFAVEDAWVFTARAEGDLLADGDVTAAAVTIDPAELDARVDVVNPLTTGRLARFHESAYDFGDGITKGAPGELPGFLMIPPEVPLDDAARTYEYTGRLQPYGMIVPPAYVDRTEPWPLIIYLHGLNNYYYEPFGVLPNLDAEIIDRGYLFAGLLGRGDLSYLNRGELDVREVIADISTAYDVDPDRIYFMGHSMGSIGSHNFVTRNPDLVAAAAPAEITASDPLLGNLMHVPWMTAGGIQDPLDLNAQSEIDTFEAMAALGYDTRTYLFQLKTHESSSIYDNLPQILDHFDRSRRVSHPGTFTYRRLADDDFPEIGIVHDRAYAASGLIFADPDRPQQIDVTSFAIPHAPLDPAGATMTDENVDEGGPSGRTIARKLVNIPAFGTSHPVSNAARVTLDNVAAVTLDLDRLALDPIVGLAVDVTTTGSTRMTFVGELDPATVIVELDGAEVSGAVTASGMVVDVPAGDHRVVLVASAADVSPTPTPLPATGGGIAAAGIAAAALGGLLRRRRS